MQKNTLFTITLIISGIVILLSTRNLLFFLLFMGGSILFNIYMLWRNNKVYALSIAVLEESIEEYKKLPSYDEMFDKFWVPVASFRKKEATS
jgi:hypothetical protein